MEGEEEGQEGGEEEGLAAGLMRQHVPSLFLLFPLPSPCLSVHLGTSDGLILEGLNYIRAKRRGSLSAFTLDGVEELVQNKDLH